MSTQNTPNQGPNTQSSTGATPQTLGPIQGSTPANLPGNDKLRSKPASSGKPKNLKNLDEGIPKLVDAAGVKVKELFGEFLANFFYGEDPNNRPYVEQIRSLPTQNLSAVLLNYADLLSHNPELASTISNNYYRFQPFLSLALFEIGTHFIKDYLYTSSEGVKVSEEHAKVLDLVIVNYPTEIKVRDLKTERVGQLCCVTGTVTRTSEVRPELVKASFRCNVCNVVVRNIDQQFKYSEPESCPNASSFCTNRRDWTLLPHESKFGDWQRVRIQENSSEIPSGSMPRSFDVILRNELVDKAKAGDKAVFTGCLIVVPDVAQMAAPGVKAATQRDVKGRSNPGFGGDGVSGLKSLGVRDLTYRLAFLACGIQTTKGVVRGLDDLNNTEMTKEKFLNSLSNGERDELEAMVGEGSSLYQKLITAIAPTVFGHEDIKRGVLLQMLGGVHKVTHEGMQLRGDINVCLVGDPSTSKSQFLKYVCGFMPRSVYTSGKASSAAGLTATVVRDEETGDFTIEAGALMLADNGVCAIDEFDKMDIKDQVAIHEAMEQQTISIAKAGVHATLNARASILAAANPIGGRYNPKLSLKQNVAMSGPIMSRFDLFFVVLDVPNQQVDAMLAQHIVNVHRFMDTATHSDITPPQLLRYIQFAKTIKPQLDPTAKHLLAQYYRALRMHDAQGIGRNSYRITVRQLESMIRLSEAVARAHAMPIITPDHVKEAYRLLRQSIVHVTDTTQAVLDDPTLPIPAQDTDTQHNEEENKLTIDRERYELIRRLLLMRLQADDAAGNQGVLQSELIQWYLSLNEGQYTTTEAVTLDTKLVKAIINDLIHREGTLLYIEPNTNPFDNLENTNHTVQPDTNDPVIMVHPNFEADAHHY